MAYTVVNIKTCKEHTLGLEEKDRNLFKLSREISKCPNCEVTDKE